MSAVDESFSRALQTLTARIVPGALDIAHLRRLSAGATLQTWSFDAVADNTMLHPLILRRSPGGLRSTESLSLEVEAELIRALAGSGAPVPTVLHTLMPEDGLGDGFLMTRIEGETIPRRILRDPEFAAIRPHLATQFGTILGAISKVDSAHLPPLPFKPAEVIMTRLSNRYESLGVARPVFEIAFRWLRQNAPVELTQYRLVHGDFRNGNMIFGSEACARCSTGRSPISAIPLRIWPGSARRHGASASSIARSADSARASNCSRPMRQPPTNGSSPHACITGKCSAACAGA